MIDRKIKNFNSYTWKNVRRHLPSLVLGAALSTAVGCSKAPQEAVKSAEAKKLPTGTVELPVEAQKNANLQYANAQLQRLPATLDVTGAVAPEESRVAHIRPLAQGVVEEIFVSLGTRVQKGQPLVTYDNIQLGELIGEYLSAKAGLRQAESDLDVRLKSLARAEDLIKLEAIAQQTLEVRRAETNSAEAGVGSARAAVSRIEEQIHRFGLSDSDLERLTPIEKVGGGHRTASHNILRAPFAGIVTKYEVASGELVGPDRELFTIADLSTVWVQADVYEKDLAKVKPGVAVTIRTDAYPDRTFMGRLTYISDLIDPTTRAAKMRCVVTNPDGVLKLDMFVRVSIPTAAETEVITVPSDAIQQIDNQPVVFVRETATRFSRRNVTIGPVAGTQTEVLSGLKAGEPVVSGGSFYIKTALLRERLESE
jgi:cobalt-zinc-cadmium efflux system membrane fusion protein